MQDAPQYIWMPPPELVAQSNLTAFLHATGRRDYDDLASQAEADPAWLCLVRASHSLVLANNHATAAGAVEVVEPRLPI